MTCVVGIDPGGRTSGVIARDGDTLLWGAILTREGPEIFPGADYYAEVADAVRDAQEAAPGAMVAVEGVVHPNGHVRVTNVSGLLGTAAVLGAVLALFPSALVVPPAKHGAGPLGSYPAALRGPREKKGAGRRRHARSAWDVAAAGVVLSGLATPAVVVGTERLRGEVGRSAPAP